MNHGQAVIAVLLMQARQMRSEFIARPAVRIAEDQKHAPATVFRERNHATLKVRQAKTGGALAGL